MLSVTLFEKIMRLLFDQLGTVDKDNYAAKLRFILPLLATVSIILSMGGIVYFAYMQNKDATLETTTLNTALLRSKDETILELRERTQFLTEHITTINTELAKTNEELTILTAHDKKNTEELAETLTIKTTLETKLQQLHNELYLCNQLISDKSRNR